MPTIKILIIEDDELQALAITDALIESDLDCEIVGEARDYREGIKLFQENEPDLTLIDIHLPNGAQENGIHLAEWINQQNPCSKIIFITSDEEKKTHIEANDIRPDGYIIKPFPFPRLFRIIQDTVADSF